MRIKKLLTTIILICCGLLCFASCKVESAVQSISLNGLSAETPLEVPFGSFPYGNYTVAVTYDNGETEEITLTEDMIPATERLKFFQIGENQITVNYEGATASFLIVVAREVFPENIQLNCKDEPYEYTGEPIVIEVVGDIPGGTKILYPEGNTFQNAGSYDMTAVLQCEGYVTKKLSAHIEIAKQPYNLEKVNFDEASFVYDKDPHTITIKGEKIVSENEDTMYEPVELPKGVTVSYTIKNSNGQPIDKAINVGTYTVTATFKGNDSNYTFKDDEGNDMDSMSMSTTMTITPIIYKTSEIEFIGKTVTYTGEAHSLRIEENQIPKNIEVSYKTTMVEDWDGNAQNKEISGTEGAKEPGVYKVVASFSLSGEYATNYAMDANEKEASLTIVRFVYETSKIDFASRVVTHTGEAYSLSVDEESKPEDVEVSYKIKKMVEGDEEEGEWLDGNSATEIGVYMVAAFFKITSEAEPHYKIDLATKVAYLTIQQASYDNELWEKIDTSKTVRLDQAEYVFIEGQPCEIYLIYALPDWITPKLTLINEAGEVVQVKEQPTEEEVIPEEEDSTEEGESAEEDFTNKKCKYEFTNLAAGEYTCVLTFEHSNDKYSPIAVKLEVSVNIIKQPEEGGL